MSILDASTKTFEANLVFALTKQYPGAYGEAIANIALNTYVNQHRLPTLVAAGASRENGNSPNTVVASAVGIVGKKVAEASMNSAKALLDLFQYTKLMDPAGEFDYSEQLKSAEKYKDVLVAGSEDPVGAMMEKALNKAGKSVFLSFCQDLAKNNKGSLSADTLLAVIWVTLGWNSLKTKKISKDTLRTLPWHSRIYSTIVGVTASHEKHEKESFCGVKMDDLLSNSFTKTAFLALMGRDAAETELFEFQVLLGLIITNGI